MNTLTAHRFGIEKAVVEPSRLRRLGYLLVGEIHIPGRIRINHVLRAVAALKLPEVGVRMLDAGTGRGDLALHLSRLHPGWEVIGIDISGDRIERCRSAAHALGITNVRFAQDDLLSLSAQAEYNLIISTDVLEHIQDDGRAVFNLARVLASGGCLILTFPSSPQRRHLRCVAWRERRIGFSPADIGHVREGYGLAQIRALLAANGLKTRLIRWTYGPFGNLAHDVFFTIGDSKPNSVVFAITLLPLLVLSFLEGHTPTHRGSGLLVIAEKS